MVKVKKLGYAIDNDEAVDSSKYRIQISSNDSNSSNTNPENNAQTQESLLLTLVTEYSQQNPEPNQGKVTKFVTTANNKIDPANNGAQIGDRSKTVTQTVDNGSNKPETAANGHHNGSIENSVTNGSNNIKTIDSNGFSDFVTTVTTITKDSDLKMGSSYLLNASDQNGSHKSEPLLDIKGEADDDDGF